MWVERVREVIREGASYCLAIVLVLVSPNFDAFVERASDEQLDGVVRLLCAFRELEIAVSVGLLAW
jgi:hypothetical protein